MAESYAEKVLDFAAVVAGDDCVVLVACCCGAGRRGGRGRGDSRADGRVPVGCRQNAIVYAKFQICAIGVDGRIYTFEKAKGDGLIECDELAVVPLQHVSRWELIEAKEKSR